MLYSFECVNEAFFFFPHLLGSSDVASDRHIQKLSEEFVGIVLCYLFGFIWLFFP